MVFNNVQSADRTPSRCGRGRCGCRWRTAPTAACCRRLWIAGEALHHLLGKRKPFLTAKRLLTNQTFRDIYRTDTLDVDQRLKITSLTFLFTDLKGSTALYERVGDLVAYDLVRQHFRVLHDIVAAEAGAVVKTIGDAVMATFSTPDRALAAALRMREEMARINAERDNEDLLAQDRHSRGAVPRGDAQRQPGLFRPDREHGGARAGARLLARYFRHQAGGGRPEGGQNPGKSGLHPDGTARRAARHCRRDHGLRNSLMMNPGPMPPTAAARTGQSRTSPEKIFPVSWDQFHRDSRALAWRLADAGPFEAIVCITRGGLVPAAIVARELGIRLIETVCVASYEPHQPGRTEGAQGRRGGGRRDAAAGEGAGVLIVDDLVDTGQTAKVVRALLPRAHFATVYAKPMGRPHGRHLHHRSVAGHLDLFSLGHRACLPAADPRGRTVEQPRSGGLCADSDRL